MTKELRTTTIKKHIKGSYSVTWCDGSTNYYKNLSDALESIKNDFLFNYNAKDK